MRNYFDFMNMTPEELAAHARDVVGNDLVLALAHQLETQAAEAVQAARLREELEETEQRATMWQEECLALQRQMDKTYG